MLETDFLSIDFKSRYNIDMNQKNTDFTRNIVTYGISLFLIFVAVILLFNATRNFLTTQQLKAELSGVVEKLEQLEKDNALLVEQRHKLQDPEYVIKYARGAYMLSKEGEKIFYLPLEPNE